MKIKYLDELASQVELVTAMHGVPTRCEAVELQDRSIVVTMRGPIAPRVAGEIALAAGVKSVTVSQQGRKSVVTLR